MAETQTLRIGGEALGAGNNPLVYCEAVGSGNWTARIWRAECGGNNAEYRLVLAREVNEEVGCGGCRLTPADVLRLPKLVQLLCSALLDDGWLEPELKDDLGCLAHAMDCVVGEAERLD
jgi:hypothetical protein